MITINSNGKVLRTCGCGVLIPLEDVRCLGCALLHGPDGRIWDIGTKHICMECPAEDCKYAFEDDPGDGLCPADYA